MTDECVQGWEVGWATQWKSSEIGTQFEASSGRFGEDQCPLGKGDRSHRYLAHRILSHETQMYVRIKEHSSSPLYIIKV